MRLQAAPLETGTILGRYVLLRPLGSGGGGDVYVAFDPELDRKVALKRLHGRARDAPALLREARTIAKLNHPHVVTVYDVGLQRGEAYLAMELIEGSDLGAWLAQPQRPSRPTEVLSMLRAAGQGLHAAHTAGIVHGDVKPANILVGDDGRVSVTDFGVARLLNADSASPSTVAGTPRYMAPEQHDGVAADVRSDVFGFAATAWESLLGAHPFAQPGDDALPSGTSGELYPAPGTGPTDDTPLMALILRKADGPPALPQDLRGVPRRVAEAIRRALHPDPSKRPQSMPELLEAFVPPKKQRWGPWVAGVAVVGAAVAVGLRPEPADTRCSGSASELSAVWGQPQRELISRRAASFGEPWAVTSATTVLERLDVYAQDWVDMHRANCEATVVRAVQATADMELRTRCLIEARAELEATADLLSSGDLSLARRAPEMVAGLPSIARCGDPLSIEQSRRQPSDPQLAESVAELRAELAPLRALERAGRYATAYASMAPLMERADALGFDPFVVEAAPLWGALQERTNRPEAAEQTLRRGVALGLEHGPPAPTARCARKLASVLATRDARFPEAEVWMQVALSQARRAGRGTALEADVLQGRGRLNFERTRWDASREDLEAALTIARRELHPDAPLIASILTNLGDTLHRLGDLEGGLAQTQKGLDLFEDAYGADHPTTAAALMNRGTIEESMGKYADALSSFEHARDVIERALGSAHLELALAYSNIGIAHEGLGNFEDAEQAYGRALSVVEAASGPRHVEAGRVLTSMGTLALRRMDYPAAQRTYERALSILEENLGADHDHVEIAALNLGLSLASQGKRAQALPFLERVLQSRSKRLAPDHPSLASVLSNLGHLELEEGLPARARARFERALEIHDAKGSRPRDRAFVLLGLGRSVHQLGESARGVELAQQAIELWREAGSGFDSYRVEAEAWLQEVAP